MPNGPTASTLRASYMPGIMLFDLHIPSHLVPATGPGNRDSNKPHLEMGKLCLADIKGWAQATHAQEARRAGLWTTRACVVQVAPLVCYHMTMPSSQPLLPGWHLVRKWGQIEFRQLIYLPSCVFPSVTGLLQFSELSVPHLVGFRV